ncbi:MAG: sialidase family protein [Ginsengibacter sp.]
MFKQVLEVLLLSLFFSNAVAQEIIPDPPGIVIDKSNDAQHVFLGSPSIVILPNGTYVASHDYFGGGTGNDSTDVFISKDRGVSWNREAGLHDQYWSTLFIHNQKLYILGDSKEYGNIVIRRSDDGGRNWSIPIDENHGLLRKGHFHCGPVPVVDHDGRIWRAMEKVTGTDWPLNFHAMVISAPDSIDLLKAQNWETSNALTFDTSWMNAAKPGWLEGNVVIAPDGRLKEIMRLNGTQGADKSFKQTGYVKGIPRYETAAILNISEDGKTLSFNPTNGFIHFPGAESKFTIRYDSISKKYWAIVNKITNRNTVTEWKYSPQHQRNVLILISSKDLRHWKENYTIISYDKGAKLSMNDKTGFQYVDWQFDGNDLISAIRTAWGNANSYHNANYLTFKRIHNFRKLKMKDSPPDLYKKNKK